MWIFHSFLILAKGYFRISDSVSERLSRMKKKKEVWGCYLMLQLSQCSIWQSKGSSATCHHPWPCILTLLSAMAAVLIPQSAVSSLRQETNSCCFGDFFLVLFLVRSCFGLFGASVPSTKLFRYFCLVIQYHWLCFQHLSSDSKLVFVTIRENRLIFAVTL